MAQTVTHVTHQISVGSRKNPIDPLIVTRDPSFYIKREREREREYRGESVGFRWVIHGSQSNFSGHIDFFPKRWVTSWVTDGSQMGHRDDFRTW